MQFLADNSMYVALIVAALILVGLLIYMALVDSRLRKLEHTIERTLEREISTHDR